MKQILKFSEFNKINESNDRVTWGEEEIHDLNSDSPQHFVTRIGDDKDVFFTDKNTAIVTKRISNVISHGRDGNKTLSLKGVNKVWCGGEGFCTPEAYVKFLKCVYNGTKFTGKFTNN